MDRAGWERIHNVCEIRWTQETGLVCKICVLAQAWSLGKYLGMREGVWKEGPNEFTWPDPGKGYAGYSWVEMLDVACEGLIGRGQEFRFLAQA